ncbi:uncharacterized protein FIBRA_01609 [Fibroporia radiculosa]|uniref:Uncharacterized protein n=1 Tax=Fibroporia radiculosa TaxID=599839 RepID=J4I8K9_9APHY|nr:uncharacterized protein FIBRA_01609 [Fibroporia radiculosa]CCL99591.1 predicted protein [Fibroporia radiculosa]
MQVYALQRQSLIPQSWSRSAKHQKLTCISARRLISCTRPHRSHENSQSGDASAEPVSAGKDQQRNLKGSDDAAEQPLPLLQRPLGVLERPSSLPRSWAQTRDELMDQEKRMEKRRHLLKAATKGYFTDLNATRRHGGKTWVAPKVMIREDKALYFPDISGTTLTSKPNVHTTSLCAGKVSIIAMLSTRISELQTASFIKPTHSQFSSHPHYQFVQINLQENLLKSLLVSLFTSSIRKSVPENLWDKYLVSSQNMDYLRDDMGMANRHVAYIYLVDQQCRIRWAGCADPMPQEVEALEVCTKVLLNRHTKPAEST